MSVGPVLVVGDANVDLVLRGDVVPRFGQAEQLLDAAELVLGGSASIVASGLARLGVATALVAVVGDDDFGRFTTAALAATGVDIRSVRVHPTEPTGISVILSTNDRAILTLPGSLGLARAADVAAAVEQTGAVHVHFASFFLLSALAVELPALLTDLRSRRITTSLDTNWDPAESWTGLADVLPLVDYLLPNGTELLAIAAALGAASDDEQSAAASLTANGTTIVGKAGAAGGWSRDSAGTLQRAAGLVVEVVDTTGAGDSFDAGFLAALAYGVENPIERLRWATVCGSLSTLRAGGTAGQPTLDELRARLDA